MTGLPEDDMEEDPDPRGHPSSLHSAYGSTKTLSMNSHLSYLPQGLCTGSSFWLEGSYPTYLLGPPCSSVFSQCHFPREAFSDHSSNLLHPSCYCPPLFFFFFLFFFCDTYLTSGTQCNLLIYSVSGSWSISSCLSASSTGQDSVWFAY